MRIDFHRPPNFYFYLAGNLCDFLVPIYWSNQYLSLWFFPTLLFTDLRFALSKLIAIAQPIKIS